MHDVGITKYFTPKLNITTHETNNKLKFIEDMTKSFPKNFYFLMMKPRIIKLPTNPKLQTIRPS